MKTSDITGDTFTETKWAECARAEDRLEDDLLQEIVQEMRSIGV
jgi:hypothetical protein